MSSCCGIDDTQTKIDNAQRKLLWTVLVLNAVMFFVEFIAGWLAQSSGLIADSLDMLADALVYSASLYAVGKSLKHKANAALLNGTMQLVLASVVIIDVVKRAIFGSAPNADMMLSVAILALVVNVICFGLLFRFRNGDLNIRASWICSRNDMLMNTGVIISALLVSSQNAAWPDLLVGLIIAAIVIVSAIGIVRNALQVRRGEADKINDCCS
ncbi:Cadmium, cobalt and zinc/H(+)-K(+) antiporter [Pseudidiomarina piscicola]|uniref:Cadmium, cobalt and zinc/H(+)-K(+) antiporter n=1 Tax=Pseudidiomarina piscicola TaxID=2614830 RepID=A0A6S6WLF9_9GAMM|nr:cation diffusion facilitator family transporter [Pseudidiomarina piscicola]CAB0150895.1 Cadmium, cobalt and zinc/H(+)-K(+) antiporter [Pseudidiomarina piscicola]VZT40401.1 Cadmium, cobalt and zinc/H(+)-K(+) antiporter [Pseudomonas aeruginosa]